MPTGYYAYIGSSSLGWAKMDESSIYGKFHWTHKSDFFNFPMGFPIHKKKSRDEITIITETGKIPERNDTTCLSPSLFSSMIYGKFHWTHKSDFFNFSIGVPIHKKKSGDEITIKTETRKTPERNDTICGSPSLSSFIVTKGKNSKNGHFDAFARD